MQFHLFQEALKNLKKKHCLQENMAIIKLNVGSLLLVWFS